MKLKIISKITGQIMELPILKAVHFWFSDSVACFLLKHHGEWRDYMFRHIYWNANGYICIKDTIIRNMEFIAHPERFVGNSIEYVGEYDFPF